MISRRGLVQGVAGMSMAGRGGQIPRRADQMRAPGTPRQQTVIGPGAKNNLRARSLVLFGAGNGVGWFEYSGTPALGNKPIAYAVPPGVTQDPFGNTLPASGGIVTVDNGLGLLARLTGNTLQFRSTTSLPNIPPSVSAALASSAGTNLSFESGKGTLAATDCNMQMLDSLQDTAQGGTGVPQVVVNSGPSANPVTSALLEVQGLIQTSGLNGITAGGGLQANTGDVIASLGKLVIAAATTPAQPGTGIILFANSAGFTKTRPSASGDTSQYTAGHTITPNTSAVNIVFGSFTNWFGGQGVAAANYNVNAHLIATIGGTGTALIFQLTGPAVGANTAVKWWLTIESGTGQQVFAGHSLGSLASVTLPSGTTVGAGGVCHIWMSAYLQFTASGTLNLQVETSVAASTATGAIGGTLEVYPA